MLSKLCLSKFTVYSLYHLTLYQKKNRKTMPHYRLSQVEFWIIAINMLVGNLCKASRNVNTFVDFIQTENNNCSHFTFPQQY